MTTLTRRHFGEGLAAAFIAPSAPAIPQLGTRPAMTPTIGELERVWRSGADLWFALREDKTSRARAWRVRDDAVLAFKHMMGRPAASAEEVLIKSEVRRKSIDLTHDLDFTLEQFDRWGEDICREAIKFGIPVLVGDRIIWGKGFGWMS